MCIVEISLLHVKDIGTKFRYLFVNVVMFKEAIQTIVDGVESILSRRWVLAKVLSLPAAAFIVLKLLWQVEPGSFAMPLYVSVLITASVLSFLLFIFISVTTHRVIIIEERVSSVSRLRAVGAKEWQFLLAFFEAGIYCLPCVVFLAIPHIGESIATVVGAYIVSRVSLMFPSIAIDAPMNARASWQATKDKQLMMFAVVFLFSVFFDGVGWVLTKIGLPVILVQLFYLITMVFLVGALSEAYKKILTQIEIGV